LRGLTAAEACLGSNNDCTSAGSGG
jgi:hypothetical protein